MTIAARKLKFVLLFLLMLGLVVPATFAQETTGGLEGTVKDPSGAVVSNATVTVTSPALIGQKTATTNDGGYYRFANLPPGPYTLTVTAPNFRTYKQENIDIQTGHLPTLNVALQVGTTSETVEVSSEAPIVDVTQSKVQTNITQDQLANIPVASNTFQSVIQFAPGARTEPLQSTASGGGSAMNGYQIDGASNTENSYLVNGQETASVFDGHSAANVPLDFVKEVQVKSSGFEAEYGGALGGVVNVIPKSGSNEWHGDIFTYYSGDAFNANDNPLIIKDPTTSANSTTRTDQPVINYQTVKDHYRTVQPGFDLGGYLVKDRLWVFGSFAPQLSTVQRVVNFSAASGTPGPRTFHRDDKTYYSMARVDFLATQKIRLFGSWTYQYARGTGTNLPQADAVNGFYNSSAQQNADNFNGGFGYVAPNVIYNAGGDITLTPNLVSTTRFGYFYQNYGDRGLANGLRDWYRDTNYPYNTQLAPADTGNPAGSGVVALNGQTLDQAAPQSVHSTNYTNIGTNYGTAFDAWKRYSFNQDLAYFHKGWGTHNLKFGYAFNHGTNDVLSGYNYAAVYIGFADQYGPFTSNGITNCIAIEQQNQALYGTYGGSVSKTTGQPNGGSCQGLWGTINIRDLGTTGKVGGWNHAFYGQDAWTVGHGLTLNVGVRLDKENLPSYDKTSGFQGISFGWGDKVAPRLGASWDVLGNGKVKLFGSFGYFYDIMKYQLPRGSFGGDYWHDCVYALDTPDWSGILPTRNSAGHYCPQGGGSVPANGTFPAGGLRFIENVNFREPANDPNQIGSLGPTGLVDPNLKPMKQHEMVVGADWELSPTLALETRYSRKRLDRTIEDAGTITQDGEVYYITNPGFGINAVQPNCNGCPPNPKANRSYDGLEVRLTKRGGGRWFGAVSYTYSRLYGNYSGLTATDISDSIGRNGANTDRAFDEPYMSFDASGHVIDGPLATDRPHTLKAYGYYNLKWWKFNTMIGGYQQVYSGTPLSSYVSVWGAPVFVAGRGDVVSETTDANGNWTLGSAHSMRTPIFSQTDFSIRQEMHVSKTNERLVAGVEADLTNLFNQHSPVFYDQNLIRTSSIYPALCGDPGTNCTPTEANQAGFDYAQVMTAGYDPAALANTYGKIANSRYLQPIGWQNPRTMRFKLSFTF